MHIEAVVEFLRSERSVFQWLLKLGLSFRPIYSRVGLGLELLGLGDIKRLGTVRIIRVRS